MIAIRGPTDLPLIADRDVRSLVALRMDQLGDGEPYDPQAHGELYVAESVDTAEALEEAIGAPVLTNPFDGLRFGHPDFVPVFEWIEEWPSCFEILFQYSDEGAVGIFVPKRPSIDRELTAFCAAFAVPAVV